MRTLIPKRNFSGNCKDSVEVELFLSRSLIYRPISSPSHSFIETQVNDPMDDLVYSSMNKSISASSNKLVNHSVNTSPNESVNHSISTSSNESVNHSINTLNNSFNNSMNNSTEGLSNNSLTNSIGMEFVLIPAGEFDMGSPAREKRRKLWESPVHKVTIKKPFYLSKYPVTQEQWQKVMGNSPSYFKGEKHPVENISWNEVQTFFRKLNALENADGNYQVYRLPTEVEWEYSARAGTKTAYFFGDNESKLTEYAWFLENSGFETHPVGLKKPNPWGLYDIYGNVGEWVQDEYHISYTGAPADGRAWENLFPSVSTPVRVRRGGGWNGNAGCCRSAERLFAAQDKRLNSLGFRAVREV